MQSAIFCLFFSLFLKIRNAKTFNNGAGNVDLESSSCLKQSIATTTVSTIFLAFLVATMPLITPAAFANWLDLFMTRSQWESRNHDFHEFKETIKSGTSASTIGKQYCDRPGLVCMIATPGPVDKEISPEIGFFHHFFSAKKDGNKGTASFGTVWNFSKTTIVRFDRTILRSYKYVCPPDKVLLRMNHAAFLKGVDMTDAKENKYQYFRNVINIPHSIEFHVMKTKNMLANKDGTATVEPVTMADVFQVVSEYIAQIHEQSLTLDVKDAEKYAPVFDSDIKVLTGILRWCYVHHHYMKAGKIDPTDYLSPAVLPYPGDYSDPLARRYDEMSIRFLTSPLPKEPPSAFKPILTSADDDDDSDKKPAAKPSHGTDTNVEFVKDSESDYDDDDEDEDDDVEIQEQLKSTHNEAMAETSGSTSVARVEAVTTPASEQSVVRLRFTNDTPTLDVFQRPFPSSEVFGASAAFVSPTAHGNSEERPSGRETPSARHQPRPPT